MGFFGVDNGTIGSITKFYFSRYDTAGHDLYNWFNNWTPGVSPATILVNSVVLGTGITQWILNTVTSHTSYFEFDVTLVGESGALGH